MISVIVPVYNVGKYLPRCIESILNQTYREFELLLVDDGSTDSSGIICDDYATKDHRITVYHKENEGVSEARNLGLDQANGDFVCFVDSDDYVDSRYLEVLLEMITEYQADAAVISCQEVYTLDASTIVSEDNRRLLSGDGEVFQAFFFGELTWGCPGKLFRKEVFEGLRFLKGMKYEDFYTMPYVMDGCGKCVYSTIRLYYYYQREKSTTHTISQSQVEMFFQCLNRMLYYTEEKYKEMYADVEALLVNSVFWFVVDQSLYCDDYHTISLMVRNKMRIHFTNAIKSNKMKRKNKLKTGLYLVSPFLYRIIRTFWINTHREENKRILLDH